MAKGKPHAKILELDDLVKASDMKIRYHPYGVSADLFTDRSEEILVAGAAGTGKSLGIMQKLNLVCLKYPKARIFMARKTRASMTNSCIPTFNNHVLTPPDKVRFNKQDQAYMYPNGSILAVIGLDDPEKIKSSEWDIGYIQEATEVTKNDWEMCTSRLRNWKLPYQQMIGDCNPDRPTHWLKDRCDKGLTKLLTSVHQDNPKLFTVNTGKWTQEGQKYLGKLDRLTGVRRARLFLGQWVAAEGMVYTDWDRNIHMVSKADLPSGWQEWPHYWAIDWGFIHPMVWQDWIENPANGDMYRLEEIYTTRKLVEDVAKFIKDRTGTKYVPRAIICDHDAEDRAVFERYTNYLTLPAYKNITVGIQNVQTRMKNAIQRGNGPALYFVRDGLIEVDKELQDEAKPTNTEEEIDGYTWPEIVKQEAVNSKKDEIPVDKNNHGCDATRYMAAFLDDLADDPEEVGGVVLMNEEYDEIISPY